MAGEVVEEALTDRALSESMDNDIRETYRDIQSRAPAEDADAAPIDKLPTEDIAASEAAGEAQRARDEASGQFIKGDKPISKLSGKVIKESAAAAKPDTPLTPTAAPGTEQAAADTDLALKFGRVTIDLARAPSSWKPAAKAAWAALPKEVQTEIYRRETDFSNTVLNGPLKESADFGKTVRQIVEPYRGMIEAEGGTPDRAIADLLKTAALFRTAPQATKLQTLFQLDQQFGAGLAQFIQGEVAKRADPNAPAPQQQQQTFQDPRVDQIMQALQAQEQERAAGERERQSRAAAASNSAIEAFIAAKDDKGATAYPFVDNVIADMSERVALLRRASPGAENSEILKQAYDAAVWANPETRAVLIAQQQAQAGAPADALRKVALAKRASAGHLPKRGALPATGPAKSLEDTIRDTARELGMFQ